MNLAELKSNFEIVNGIMKGWNARFEMQMTIRICIQAKPETTAIAKDIGFLIDREQISYQIDAPGDFVRFYARLSDLFSRLQHSEKPLLKFNPTESSVDSSVTMTLAEMLKQLEKISGILDAVNAIYKFQIPVILHVFATPVVIDYALALGFENAEGGFAYWFHEEKDFDRFFSMMKALQHQLMQIAHLKSISKGISKPKKNKVT